MVRDDGERTILFDMDMAIQRISRKCARTSVGSAIDRRLSQFTAPLGGNLGLKE